MYHVSQKIFYPSLYFKLYFSVPLVPDEKNDLIKERALKFLTDSINQFYMKIFHFPE